MIDYPKDEIEHFIAVYEEPAHHMETLLKASIITLDIRPRLLFPLWNAGIRTVGELSRQYRLGLRSIPQIGEVSEYEIGLLLCSYGVLDVHFVHSVHGVHNVNT